MNNTYSYIEVLLADAREWRALGRLIDLTTEGTNLEKLHGATSAEPLFHLGYVLHPTQDLHGHGDDYVKYGNLAGFFTTRNWHIFWATWNHGYFGERNEGTYADAFASIMEKHGITYYHWDDVIRSRDLTYDIIGGYFVERERQKE